MSTVLQAEGTWGCDCTSEEPSGLCWGLLVFILTLASHLWAAAMLGVLCLLAEQNFSPVTG